MAKQDIIAVCLRKSVLEWTSLRMKKGRFEVRDHQETSLELEADPSETGSVDPAPAVKAACAGIKGLVGVSMPTEEVLLRVVELPAVEEDELRGMVELQVDKFSPFPIEQMAVSFEVLAQNETSTRVLITATRQELVDRLGETFSNAGMAPRWIDVEILGWWTLLKEHADLPKEGRLALLLLEKEHAELVVVHDGVPVLFRSLGGHTGLSDEDEIMEMVEEVSYTLTSLEAEWGAARKMGLSLWSGDGASTEFAASLQRECGVLVDVHQLSDLPSLTEGLAQRFAMREKAMVNLAPPIWRAAEHRRHMRKVMIVLSVLFLGIWASGVAVFLVGLNMQKNKLAAMKSEAVRLDNSAAEVRAFQAKVRSLDEYADRTHSSLECLREISVVLPGGVELSSYSYKKGKTVNLRGEADREGPVYDYIAALEKSDMFIDVKPEGISTRRRRGRMKTEFRITLQLPGEES